MQLLIPLSDVRYRLQALRDLFFFLKGGLDEAILSVLEEYKSPRDPQYEAQYEFEHNHDSSKFLMDQFEQHISELHLSNSCYRNIDNIYNNIELAILVVKSEVNHEFKQFVGNERLQVRWARNFTRYDCLVYVDFE